VTTSSHRVAHVAYKERGADQDIRGESKFHAHCLGVGLFYVPASWMCVNWIKSTSYHLFIYRLRATTAWEQHTNKAWRQIINTVPVRDALIFPFIKLLHNNTKHLFKHRNGQWNNVAIVVFMRYLFAKTKNKQWIIKK